MVDVEAQNKRYMEGLIHQTKIKNCGELCLKIYMAVLIVWERRVQSRAPLVFKKVFSWQ